MAIDHRRGELGGPFDVSPEPLKLWRQAAERRGLSEIYGDPGISPVSFASAIDFRDRLRRKWPEYATTPADIHVLAYGEPENRAATKFGGLPFRPAGAPWPVTAEGEAYAFICQFRFTESQDILPPLPGDVLLVFFKEVDIYTGDPEFAYFEWQSSALADLMTESELRGEIWPYIHAYGLRYRSFDFVEFDRVAQRQLEWLKVTVTDPVNPSLWRMLANPAARLSGVKIGGLPCWLAEQPDDAPPENRFLCGFPVMFPDNDVEFPWANVQEPIPLLRHSPTPGNEYLNWFDGFSLHFFLTEEQQVEWYLEIG